VKSLYSEGNIFLLEVDNQIVVNLIKNFFAFVLHTKSSIHNLSKVINVFLL